MKRAELEKNLRDDIRKRKRLFQKRLAAWGKKHYRNFPWRENKTPYSVLISEVLLKRTTASAVKGIYSEFMSSYPDLNRMAEANPKKLENFLLRIGYNKVRAKILIEMANYILNKKAGLIPKSEEELLEIPHVGNYTANAILSFVYDKPAAIVDTNVERIIRRVFLNHLSGEKRLKTFQDIAEFLLPKRNASQYNYALLDLGGTVCISALPKCVICPINKLCDYYSRIAGGV